jgi:hypothetical protein
MLADLNSSTHKQNSYFSQLATIVFQIFSYKTYELHPPHAALDIKIDLTGQLTGQLVAVLHEVSQHHVTDPVPEKKM